MFHVPRPLVAALAMPAAHSAHHSRRPHMRGPVHPPMGGSSRRSAPPPPRAMVEYPPFRTTPAEHGIPPPERFCFTVVPAGRRAIGPLVADPGGDRPQSRLDAGVVRVDASVGAAGATGGTRLRLEAHRRGHPQGHRTHPVDARVHASGLLRLAQRFAGGIFPVRRADSCPRAVAEGAAMGAARRPRPARRLRASRPTGRLAQLSDRRTRFARATRFRPSGGTTIFRSGTPRRNPVSRRCSAGISPPIRCCERRSTSAATRANSSPAT